VRHSTRAPRACQSYGLATRVRMLLC
jgi:hypothetical protein